jgi:hypothetical protein
MGKNGTTLINTCSYSRRQKTELANGTNCFTILAYGEKIIEKPRNHSDEMLIFCGLCTILIVTKKMKATKTIYINW